VDDRTRHAAAGAVGFRIGTAAFADVARARRDDRRIRVDGGLDIAWR
jgi:hypothetical protein